MKTSATQAKISLENDGWTSKNIPKLLGMAYYELIKEEAWNFIKENKMPTINFKTLNHFVIDRIKQLKPEIFQ